MNKYTFPEAKDITEENFVEKINFQIKHFDNELIYYIRTNKQNCLIEISINDVSLVDDYEISNLINPLEIGHILKSGTQKITVKMYPVGNQNNECLGVKEAPPMTKLTDESQVAISIISIDEKSGKGFDDEKIITKKVSPKEAAGKEYYEFSFTFNATVPYKFEGWAKRHARAKVEKYKP